MKTLLILATLFISTKSFAAADCAGFLSHQTLRFWRALNPSNQIQFVGQLETFAAGDSTSGITRLLGALEQRRPREMSDADWIHSLLIELANATETTPNARARLIELAAYF